MRRSEDETLALGFEVYALTRASCRQTTSGSRSRTMARSASRSPLTRGMSPFAFQVMMVVGSRRGTDGDAAEAAVEEERPKMEAVVEEEDEDEDEDEEEEEEAPVFGRFGARVRNLSMAVLVRACCVCVRAGLQCTPSA